MPRDTCISILLALALCGCAAVSPSKSNQPSLPSSVVGKPEIPTSWSVSVDPAPASEASQSSIERSTEVASAEALPNSEILPELARTDVESAFRAVSTDDASASVATDRDVVTGSNPISTAALQRPQSVRPPEKQSKKNDAKHQKIQSPLSIPVATNLSADEIFQEMQATALAMIAASKAEYRKFNGICPCPNDVHFDGHQCGDRSGYNGSEHRRPLCYIGDVTPDMIADYRRTRSILYAGR